jgi:hypothetical protein
MKGKQPIGSSLIGMKIIIYLDDFNKLVNTTTSREQRLLKKIRF